MIPIQYNFAHSRVFHQDSRVPTGQSSDSRTQAGFYRPSATRQGDIFLFSPSLCSRNSQETTSRSSGSFDGLLYTCSPANDRPVGAKIDSPPLLPGYRSSRSPLFIEAYLAGVEPKSIARSSPGTPFQQLFNSSPTGYWQDDENSISPISRNSTALADSSMELGEEDEGDEMNGGSGKGKIKSLLEYEKSYSVPESPVHGPSTPSSLSSLTDVGSSPSALFSHEPHPSSQTSRGRTSCFSSPAHTDEGAHASFSPLGSPFKPSIALNGFGTSGPSSRRYRRAARGKGPSAPQRSLASEILNQLGQHGGRSRLGASSSAKKFALSPTGPSDTDSDDENYEPSGPKSRKRARSSKAKSIYSSNRGKRQRTSISVSAPASASASTSRSQEQAGAVSGGEDDGAEGAEDANAIRTYPNRTFPLRIPIHDNFALFYRRFPVSSVVDHELAAIRIATVPDGTPNEPRDVFDLYTPRFVKGRGTSKVGLCPICHEPVARGGEGKKLWLSMKFSAFNYHMQYYHGISAPTGRPFSPPTAFRTVSRPNASKHEKTRIMEGKCHRCTKWVPVEGIKDVEAKVREIFWWKHAAGCHQGDTLEGEADVFVEDAVWSAVVQAADGPGVRAGSADGESEDDEQ
ncbi:hypothetical protein BD311DRAFT_788246 [Dichomitus squalens]|uniref:Transcription regulator Rua1 C-terminal domain-containing protein n=1 Tax=Dichomitus squalens TaxID=114155 RepID=A0A4Q9MNV8_9APHY|nr:hypothetical protein BD311DRAFT_788246 [Dichomitus squalens]